MAPTFAPPLHSTKQGVGIANRIEGLELRQKFVV